MSDTENYLHVAHTERTAYINGPVNECMQHQFAEALEACAGEEGEPITIYLSTAGGDIYVALAIFDLIKLREEAGNPVCIVATGECMSAGTLILQAGYLRYATPSTQFLIHFGSESSDSAAELKHLREVEKYWFQKFVERTGKTMRTVRRWHSGETYFNAKEALADGLIDEIVGGLK